MKAFSLDEVLERVSTTKDWQHPCSLAGVSEQVNDFVRQFAMIDLRGSENSREVISIDRPRGCARVDDAIVRDFDFSDGSRVNLDYEADSYNCKLLFGTGSRSGCLELNPTDLVVVNADAIPEAVIGRLRVTISQQLTALRRLLVIADHRSMAPELIATFKALGATRDLRIPRLHERIEDIAYEIHFAAMEYKAGLDSFSADSVQLLCSHPWHGDVHELDTVVQKCLRLHQGDGLIDGWLVAEQLSQATFSLSHSRATSCDKLWSELVEKQTEANQLTTALMQLPFFVTTAATTPTPVGSDAPEFDFFRLVSWGYVCLFEQARSNLPSVERLMGGLGVNPGRIKSVREYVDRLRTFLQHSLQYNSDRDRATIEAAGDWFQLSIGRRLPSIKDYEKCSRKLLMQLHDAHDDLLQFLRKVNDDELRELTLRQWRHMRETSWPKNQFQQIVDNVLISQDRDDLNGRVVCERVLNQLQERLSATNDSQDRVAILTATTERLIAELFPEEIPVCGRDLIELGIPAGPKIGLILAKMREHFAQHRGSRESLLGDFHEVIRDAKS